MLEFRSVCGLLHSQELVYTKLVDGTAQLKQVTSAKNDKKVVFPQLSNTYKIEKTTETWSPLLSQPKELCGLSPQHY